MPGLPGVTRLDEVSDATRRLNSVAARSRSAVRCRGKCRKSAHANHTSPCRNEDQSTAIALQDYGCDITCQTQRSATAEKLAVEPVLSRDHGRSLGNVDLADLAAQLRAAAGSLIQAADIEFPHARLQSRAPQAEPGGCTVRPPDDSLCI